MCGRPGGLYDSSEPVRQLQWRERLKVLLRQLEHWTMFKDTERERLQKVELLGQLRTGDLRTPVVSGDYHRSLHSLPHAHCVAVLIGRRNTKRKCLPSQ